jgi:transposase
VILPGGPLKVFVATRPVDFRKGVDGLAALAAEELRLDPFSGAVLVFRAKRADRVKILVWDGSGMVLVTKRLESGKFAWPPVNDGVMRLSSAQLAALVEGLDWRRVYARQRVARPQAAG